MQKRFNYGDVSPNMGEGGVTNAVSPGDVVGGAVGGAAESVEVTNDRDSKIEKYVKFVESLRNNVNEKTIESALTGFNEIFVNQ